jgi:hypothetical protein
VISSFPHFFVDVGLVLDCDGDNRHYRTGGASSFHHHHYHGDHKFLSRDATTWTHYEDVPDLVNGLVLTLEHPVVDDVAAADRDAATTFAGVVMTNAEEGDDYSDHHYLHYYSNEEKGEGVDRIHDHSY